MSFQKGWKWCNRCDGMFYAGQPNVCPLGGSHDAGGSASYVAQLTPTANAQDGWRFCQKCGGMCYGMINAGVCPAGGGHDVSSSGAYSAFTNKPMGFAQDGWRWCNKCQGMFFGGRAGGACKAGGPHSSSGSNNYSFTSQLVGSGIAIAHQGAGNDGTLWLTTRLNGNWSDVRIPGGASGTPSPIMFANKLYIFYQGQGNSKDLWYTIYDGVGFSDTLQAPNIRIQGSPHTTILQNSISTNIGIFLQGTSDDHQLWLVTYDSNKWQSDNFQSVIKITNDPTGVVIPGIGLWIIYDDANNPGTLQIRTPNGNGTYAVQKCASSNTPAAIMYKNQVYLFHQGANSSGQLYYKIVDANATSAPGFHDDIHIPCGMSALPAPVVDGDTLYVFHEGYGNSGQLWYVSYDGSNWASDQQVPNVGVSTGCGATTFNFSG